MVKILQFKRHVNAIRRVPRLFTIVKLLHSYDERYETTTLKMRVFEVTNYDSSCRLKYTPILMPFDLPDIDI